MLYVHYILHSGWWIVVAYPVSIDQKPDPSWPPSVWKFCTEMPSSKFQEERHHAEMLRKACKSNEVSPAVDWHACRFGFLITLNRSVWFGAKSPWKQQKKQQSPIHGFRTWKSTIPWLFEAGDGLDQTGTISWGTGSLHSASTQKVDIVGWRSLVAGCRAHFWRCFWLKDELGPSSFGGWFQESL